MSNRKIIVTCQSCGSQYEMPDIGVKPIMKDCPTCKGLDKTMKELLGDLYTPTTSKEKKR